MTADQVARLLATHPKAVLVPVALELAPEVLVEWVECERFRLTPRRDGMHDLHIERKTPVHSA